MNLASTVLLALAMSADTFAVAVCKGAALHRPRWGEALRTGSIFGVIEALTPIAGWAVGQVAAPYVRGWDHWIAFGLLLGLGVRMVTAGLRSAPPDAFDRKPARHAFWMLALAGLATSLDAFAVGVSLAFLEAAIVMTAIAIGLATLVMVTLGVMLGRVLGGIVGRRAEVLGGLVLIGIGSYMLAPHL